MGEKIHKFRLLEQFLPSSQTKKLVMLTGARQTGKTTLVKLTYPDLRYINLDAPENRDAVRTIASALWARDMGNAVVDEAQKEPQIFEKIKYSFDEGGISFSVLLGSSQILLLKKIRESLAGRVSLFELWPLLMSEIYSSAAKPSEIKRPLLEHALSDTPLQETFRSVPAVLIGEDDSYAKDAENYLLAWGGMPALLPLSEEERWKWLRDYEYTYLERDLSDLARLDDLEPFRKFQKLSALRSGHLLNYSELARDASVSVDTARRYLEYLRISYQVILLQPFHRNITSSAVKTPKIYWLDVGLMRQLAGFRSEVSGQIYETMVVGEILKWIKTAQTNAEVFFYRTRSGLELDLLLRTERGVLGMEIKNRETLVSSDIRPMKEVAKGLGREWRGGVVVYRGSKIEPLDEPNIWAVPSRRLFT